MMGASSMLYKHLFSGGMAQVLVNILAECDSLDLELLDRCLDAIQHILVDHAEHRDFSLALFRRVGL